MAGAFTQNPKRTMLGLSLLQPTINASTSATLSAKHRVSIYTL